MQKTNDIMVSICCMTFNHEPYIRKCLDGFVAQKTNFAYEVLIHDDASTDKTVDIIREYENKYPDIIKPIYQKTNQYSQGIHINNVFQYSRANGKYLAYCEGDDFWTDEYKLQKQFDFLELHSDCTICTHAVQGIDAKTNQPTVKYPPCDVNEIIAAQDYIKLRVDKGYLFQTSSYFLRRDCLNEYIDIAPEFERVAKVGDEPRLLFFVTRGNLGFINEVMSCYRTNSIGSWSSQNTKKNPERLLNNSVNITNMFISFNSFTYKKYEADLEIAITKLRKQAYYYKKLYRLNHIDISRIGLLTADEEKEINKRVRISRAKNFIRNKFPFIINLIKK